MIKCDMIKILEISKYDKVRYGKISKCKNMIKYIIERSFIFIAVFNFTANFILERRAGSFISIKCLSFSQPPTTAKQDAKHPLIFKCTRFSVLKRLL